MVIVFIILLRETASILNPDFCGPEVVTISRFHCTTRLPQLYRHSVSATSWQLWAVQDGQCSVHDVCVLEEHNPPQTVPWNTRVLARNKPPGSQRTILNTIVTHSV